MSPEEWLAAQSAKTTLPEPPTIPVPAAVPDVTQKKQSPEEWLSSQSKETVGIPADAVPRETINQPEPGTMDTIKGIGETALSFGTGATSGAVGMIGGFLNQLAKEIIQGNYGTKEAADRIEQASMELAGNLTYSPKTEAGKGMVETVGSVMQPIAAATPPLSAEMTLTRAGNLAAKQPIKPAIQAPTEQAMLTAQKAVSGEKAAQLVESIPQTGKLAQIAETIKRNPYDAESAGYRLIDGKVMGDALAIEAIKQGIKPGVVASIKASSPEDIKRMQAMLNVHKLGKKSEKFRAENRPADVLGKTVENRISYLLKTNKEAGREVNSAAKALKDKQVDYNPAINQFVSDLENIGVKVEPKEGGGMRAVLKGSDIEGDRGSAALIGRVLERLSETDTPKSGYDIHRAKQFLDTQLEYGKKSKNPLSAKTEIIIKGLRRNLNNALREASPAYKTANDKFSNTIDALNSYKKAVGAKVELDSPNVDKALGLASRKLLTNYASRTQLIDAMDKIEKTAKQYGLPINDDVMNQLIVVNEIDRMFGAPADMTFKGQFQSAMKTGVEAARRSLAENAIDLATKGLDKIKGINEDAAIESLDKLLKREANK